MSTWSLDDDPINADWLHLLGYLRDIEAIPMDKIGELGYDNLVIFHEKMVKYNEARMKLTREERDAEQAATVVSLDAEQIQQPDLIFALLEGALRTEG